MRERDTHIHTLRRMFLRRAPRRVRAPLIQALFDCSSCPHPFIVMPVEIRAETQRSRSVEWKHLETRDEEQRICPLRNDDIVKSAASTFRTMRIPNSDSSLGGFYAAILHGKSVDERLRKSRSVSEMQPRTSTDPVTSYS